MEFQAVWVEKLLSNISWFIFERNVKRIYVLLIFFFSLNNFNSTFCDFWRAILSNYRLGGRDYERNRQITHRYIIQTTPGSQNLRNNFTDE